MSKHPDIQALEDAARCSVMSREQRLVPTEAQKRYILARLGSDYAEDDLLKPGCKASEHTLYWVAEAPVVVGNLPGLSLGFFEGKTRRWWTYPLCHEIMPGTKRYIDEPLFVAEVRGGEIQANDPADDLMCE